MEIDVAKAIGLYNEHKNLDIVAKMMDVCRPTLTKYLKANGVDIKFGGKRAILNGNITDYERELIIAGVLGDGNIRTGTTKETARFQLSSKHLEYLEWYKDQFISQKGKVYYGWRKDPRMKEGGSNIGYVHFQYSREIKEIHDKWYKEGKKVLADDLEFTPTILLHWFLQDGHYDRSGTSNRIVLSTDCFSYEEVCWLLIELRKEYGLHFVTNHTKSGYQLRSNSESVKKWFEVVGDSPVRCFDYKFGL